MNKKTSETYRKVNETDMTMKLSEFIDKCIKFSLQVTAINIADFRTDYV